MKLKSYNLLIFFWLIFLPFKISAQQPATFPQSIPGMCKIDYKLVFLLHPLMAEYDFTVGRHLRTDIDLKNPKNREKAANRMKVINAAAQKEELGLQNQIKAKRAELEKIEFDRRRSFESPKEPNSSENLAALTKKREKAEKELEELEKSRLKVFDKVFDPMYVSRQNSEKKVTKALNQIDSTLKKISEELGGVLIVDSDFVGFAKTETTFHPTMEVSFNLQNIGLRQSLLEHNTDFDPSRIPQHYAKTKEREKWYQNFVTNTEGFKMSLSTTFSKYPGVAAALGTRGRLFLVGGEKVDVTKRVLAEIYKLNEIRDVIIYRILENIPESE